MVSTRLGALTPVAERWAGRLWSILIQKPSAVPENIPFLRRRYLPGLRPRSFTLPHVVFERTFKEEFKTWQDQRTLLICQACRIH